MPNVWAPNRSVKNLNHKIAYQGDFVYCGESLCMTKHTF